MAPISEGLSNPIFDALSHIGLETTQHLLNDDVMWVAAFENFLVEKHCAENLEYIKTTNKYLHLLEQGNNYTADMAQMWETQVYQEFLTTESPMECNFPFHISELFHNCHEHHSIPSKEMIHSSRQHIFSLILDAYRQFILSPDADLSDAPPLVISRAASPASSVPSFTMSSNNRSNTETPNNSSATTESTATTINHSNSSLTLLSSPLHDFPDEFSNNGIATKLRTKSDSAATIVDTLRSTSNTFPFIARGKNFVRRLKHTAKKGESIN